MSRYPKLREDIVAKQQVMAGEVSYMVKIRDPQKYLRFPVADWDFVCLLDGLTSFEEIAERYSQMHPESPMSPRSVESYVESLKKSDVIERTPAEQSIVILEKLQAERQKRAEQSATQDVFYLTLAHTNPEKFYKAIFPYIRWIWTRQFVIATLLLFTAAASVGGHVIEAEVARQLLQQFPTRLPYANFLQFSTEHYKFLTQGNRGSAGLP